ncbi:adenylyl-sulfate kinase [Marinoscillum furvescens]|uniref:Adenylyl-sulfate kinase n=1 Tax=Marinoscillum furvescens DSM 4134 TaxID=1122208 RepID=A0A3D9L7L4_MARFU|nr:adenylyl-sulfate kinase [Marinoscillum furvescens]REE01649.1 adenylylsulfate kinase [Marinoscillum furvescens DSM 4134]
MSTNENIIPHQHTITLEDRVKKNGYRPKLLWFTGLSGSGKSTLASALETYLHQNGFQTYILDGDNVRSGLNKDLDFSDDSRKENIRRISEVSKLFVDAGLIVLTAFISPFREDRATARSLVGDENFIEVFVDTPLEECEKRDVKGLYAKARAGKIPNFTGIDSPFERPENPEVHIETVGLTVEESLNVLLEKILPLLK